MSAGIYIYVDEDDEVRVEYSQTPDVITTRVGNVVLYLRHATATQLHTALGRVLAAAPDEQGGS
jgi:exo-beta-1,3-glucanase (GH17 family)